MLQNPRMIPYQRLLRRAPSPMAIFSQRISGASRLERRRLNCCGSMVGPVNSLIESKRNVLFPIPSNVVLRCLPSWSVRRNTNDATPEESPTSSHPPKNGPSLELLERTPAKDFFADPYFYNGKQGAVNLYSDDRKEAFGDRTAWDVLSSAKNLGELIGALRGTFIEPTSVEVYWDHVHDSTETGDHSDTTKAAVETFVNEVAAGVPGASKRDLTRRLLHGISFNQDRTADSLKASIQSDCQFYQAKPTPEQIKSLLRAVYPDSHGAANKVIRAVPADYEVTDTELSHKFDLDCFVDHVTRLADDYWENTENPIHVGPYFCLVQSSGMGKTKLLYEYKRLCQNGILTDFDAKIILCGSLKTFTGVFDASFDPLESDSNDQKNTTSREGDRGVSISSPTESKGDELELKHRRKLVASNVFEALDKLVNGLNWKDPCKFRVLMFDEAQFLLQTEYEMQAFLFRCVRLWLREIRDKHQYVAVFTGTSSGLTNFQVDSDRILTSEPISRGMQIDRRYIDKGTIVFAPFVTLTTSGCQIQVERRGQQQEQEQLGNDSLATEYDQAIVHGRPLFSIMREKGDLEDMLPRILRRMLLRSGGLNTTVHWENDNKAWLSILATRVQMGIASFAVASDLVAKGYANLLHVSDDYAYFTFFPEPVCCRLAMGMMTKGWTLDGIAGKDPKEWANRLGQIFSTGLCRPEKGDFGEILSALYMLLCGDILRRKSDKELKTFSIDLIEWLDILGKSKSVTNDGMDAATNESYNLKREKSVQVQPSVRLSCVHFSRNFLRSYGKDWTFFKDEQFLKNLYSSGTGFFTFEGCPLIDAVLPLCIDCELEKRHIPLLLSIKSRISFGPKEAGEVCQKMKTMAKKAELQALCLVVVFGCAQESKDQEPWSLDNKSVRSQLEKGETVCKVFRIPPEDQFGISNVFLELTRSTQLMEVYASHPFIRAHSESASDREYAESSGSDTVWTGPLDPKVALRAIPESQLEKSQTMLKQLADQLKLSPGSSVS